MPEQFRSRFRGALTACFNVGTIAAYASSPALIESYGWPVSYRLQATRYTLQATSRKLHATSRKSQGYGARHGARLVRHDDRVEEHQRAARRLHLSLVTCNL